MHHKIFYNICSTDHICSSSRPIYNSRDFVYFCKLFSEKNESLK